ncbi:MAG: AAA family ATPase, partial [Propionibacterium sp.]|nr:AAA family ATPase [Propionibacterium sp.]
PGEPFGGVQIVLVGDLYQLPPVVTEAEREFFTTTYATPYFFSARHYERDVFPMVQLTRIFRQAGDDALTDILNGIREGTIDDESRATLNARTRPDFEPPLDELWLTLAGTNRIAGARNRAQLERLETPLVRHQSVRTGDLDRFEPPTDDDLRFKVGAQVMMLANDPAHRFVNGTLGHVVAWDAQRGTARVATAEGGEFDVGPHTWEVTRPGVVGGRLTHEVIGTFTQLPFKLAWAITIHKSQGQTLERLNVDLTGGTFAYGQLYVALSRATSMDGLVLKRDVLPRDLKTDTRIRRFLSTGSATEGHRGYVYVAMLPVGDEGRMWRPRPLEMAAVTDDGEELSTLVDPQRDLGEARTEYGITASEAALAPTLVDAWAAMSPLLDGRVPVGVDVDRELGWIDFEFKRLGRVVPIPSGIELDPDDLTPAERAGLQAPTALERARAIRDAARRLEPKDPFADEFGPAGGVGYTLARRDVSPRLASRGDLAELLRVELEGKTLAAEERELVRGVEASSGVGILADADEASDVDAALVDGARVCFTGSVVDGDGRA